jgi:hypothetical protein
MEVQHREAEKKKKERVKRPSWKLGRRIPIERPKSHQW